MKDWLGQEYDVGDLVIYPAPHGNHGANMRLAKVVKFNKNTVTVQPLMSARYGDIRNHCYVDTRTWRRIDPYASGNWKNPDIWVNPLADSYSREGQPKKELQPWIEIKEILASSVAIKVTVNITKVSINA
jgi:hypothetical protein